MLEGKKHLLRKGKLTAPVFDKEENVIPFSL